MDNRRLLQLLVLLFFTSTTSYAQTTITLNPTRDTYLSNAGANSKNYGTCTTLDLRYELNKPLFYFDYTAIPAGATITSAVFRFNKTNSFDVPLVNDVEVHRITTDWNEGTECGAGGIPNANDPWTNFMGDFHPDVEATTTVTEIHGIYTWDVTNMVSQFHSGAVLNYGFGLLAQAPDHATFWDSREGAVPPELVITYTTLTLSTSVTDESCAGAQDGAVDLTVTGNVGTTTYAWTGSGGFTASTQDISGLEAGTYNVTVTDDNGPESTSAIVNLATPPLVLSTDVTQLSAAGASDGAIDLTITSGAPGFSYSWTKDGSPYATTEDISGLDAGVYAVTVTDGCGQNETTSVTIQFTGTAQKYLYLSDPGQGLDRIDPVATGDGTTSSVSFVSQSGSVTISDDYSSNSYSGGTTTNPLRNWSGPWVENDANGGGAASGNFYVESTGTDSGTSELYIKEISAPSGFIYREVNLLDATSAILSVDFSRAEFSQVDEFEVQASNNGGTSYVTIGTENNLTNNQVPMTRTYDLIAALGSVSANTRIRFQWTISGNGTGSILGIDGVSIDSNILSGGQSESFVQAIPMCLDFNILSGQTIQIETYVNVTTGIMSTNPDITATLLQGGTTLLNLTNPTYSSGAGTVVWTGSLGSDVTLLAGQALTLEIQSNESNISFDLLYDSASAPSKIELSTDTYINITQYAFYDAPYPGGNEITEAIVGETVYIRTAASDPFGNYDITGSDLEITDPSAVTTMVTATEVAAAGCEKTYEYTWTVPAAGGEYQIQTTAYEGTEGVQVSETLPFSIIIPYTLSKTLSSPATGPYTVGDQVTFELLISNDGGTDINILPLQDIFDTACLQYVSASQAPDNNANGVLTWNNLGPLAGSSTISIDVTLEVVGNCDPTNNLAKVEGATDSNGNTLETKTSSVDITIDEAPVTIDDSYCVSAGQELDVLANDSDADNDMTTLTVVSGPSAGLATVTASNTIQFNPSGMTEDQTVTFTYQICDAASPTPYCNTAEVTVTYSATNSAPAAISDTATTTLNMPVTIAVLANDSDAEGDLDTASISIIANPSFGSATVNPDGTIRYTPNTSFTGTDQLTYEICDLGCPGTQCATATLTIMVEYAEYACQEPGVQLSVDPVPGADGYVWSLPPGASITSGDGTNSIVADFSLAAAGNYTICVEPTNDCGPGSQQCVQLVINEVILAAATTDVSCAGETSGTIDLQVSGGLPPYAYSWSNGASVEDLNNLSAGTYDVTVTDDAGCSASLSVTLTEPATVVSVTGLVTDENPFGSLNGVIDISPSGGTPGYSYTWSNGATTEDIRGLAGGTYTVIVTDSNACTTEASFTVNTVGGPLEITAIEPTHVNCFGDSTGLIDLEVIGGTGSYTYTWSNGATTQDLTNLSAGTYDVVVSDGVNLDVMALVEIVQPAGGLTVNLVPNQIQCFDTATGAVDATVGGGTAPYTFSWSNGATTEDINTLAVGSYTLTVTDANGCTIIDTVTLTEPAEMTLTGSLGEATCGSGADGLVDLTVTGGTTPYTYVWSNGATSEDLNGIAAGIYSVTVTDALGCEVSQTFTVETTCLGLTKAVVATPINNGDGSYTLTYEISIANPGESDITQVDPLDDLQTTFAAATSFAVDAILLVTPPASGGWSVNPSYDGSSDIHLLPTPTILGAGESATFRIQVSVIPGNTLNYDNSATASGTTAQGVSVSDASQDGNTIDPDGDGDPTNNNVPTSISFTENPELGVAKTVSTTPVNNGNGSYTLTYQLRLENTGDVPINDVQLSDDLATSFPGLTLSGVVSSIITQPAGSTLTLNGGYDGNSNTDLLAGTDTLPSGSFGILEIQLTVALNGNLGPYLNSAIGSGTSPASSSLTDNSHNGTNVDPEGDGTADNSDPTPIIFTENPELGVAKTVVSGPVNNGDGSHALIYRIRMENTGDTPLQQVQLTDDLGATFVGATTSGVGVTIAAQPSSTVLSINLAYDGTGDTAILDGSGTLLPGEYALIDLAVTVTLNGNLGPFDNTAEGTGTGPGGTPVTDLSHNGSQVDPEGDGPGDNSEPTPVVFTENPLIGIAKTVSSPPVNNEDGSYTFSYTFLIENLGDITLQDIQLTDDLASTFSGAGLSVDTLTSPDFSLNPSFNGSTDTNILAGGNTLAAATSSTVTMTLTVTPGTYLGPYDNSATGFGTSSGSTVVTDISWNGTATDPDGDGDPTNNASVTPMSFVENPIIGAAKRISAGPTETTAGSGVYDLTYEIRIENTGDVPLNDVQLYESLTDTFDGAMTFTISNYIITQQPLSSTLATDPSYNGDSTNTLLTPGGSLGVGEFAIITLSVQVTPGNVGGPYNNSALAAGTSTGGETLIDPSADGTVVDVDGDGLTTDDNIPTSVIFFENPLIGLAKELVSVTDNGNGTNTVELNFVLENFGDVDLNNLNLYDDIASQFIVVSPTNLVASSADLLVNTGWNGTASSNILEPGQVLEFGQVATVTITFDAIPNVPSLDNTATAEGTGPLGGVTIDQSTAGNNADGTDADDNPDENTPTTVTFAPVFDYSDAPDSYGTPRHLVVSGTYLGNGNPDTEFNALNVANGGTDGTGDNTTGIDDENLIVPQLVLGRNTVMTIAVSGAGGYLQGWIDFDLNGVFDASEQVITDVQDGGASDLDGTINGSIEVAISVPSNATTNATYARFRWASQAGLDTFSEALDGEIEDYGGITIRRATVITNRRITYRVKKD